MKYRIQIPKNWQMNRRQFFTPGIYRVPEDVSEKLAQRAISESRASRLSSPEKAKPALTKKKLDGAPENKSRLGE